MPMDMVKLMMAGKGGESAPEAAGDDLTAAMHDFLIAVGKKDTAAMAEAFRAGMACSESEAGEAEKE